jgi:uncharacterized OB-fold protein
MPGAHYISLECFCGHRSESMLADWPEDQRGEAHLKQSTLDRMRCTACGRVGRPRHAICGWMNVRE